MPTLTTSEVLTDVLDSFKKRFPALNRMSTNFNVGSLKLNQTYYAHIPTLPSAEDVSTTYAVTGAAARSLLVDVPVTVNKHKAVLLNWTHFDAIKDNKNEYDKVIANAGYVLAKAVIDDILSGVTSVNFSQQSIFAHADCDVDMLGDVTGDLNTVGAAPNGRTLILNTTATGYLNADTRMTSRDYQGQLQGGEGYRHWRNVYGFEDIIEYPDFPTNNGAALTSVALEADDEIFTKTSHGLVTGQRVHLTAITGGTGFTQGNYYYVHRLTANTFYLCASVADAVAGTPVAASADGSSITITPNENLAAFAFDPRAVALVAGVPADFNSEFLAGLNIPRTMGFEQITDPETGLSMAAVSWQAVGTGILYWAPTLVWGKSLGRQSGAVAAGTITDYAGHRVVTA